MKNFLFVLTLMQLLIWGQFATAQQKESTPDLSKVYDPKICTINKGSVQGDKEIHINKKPGDGLVYLNNLSFGNGTIEVDIKGKEKPCATIHFSF